MITVGDISQSGPPYYKQANGTEPTAGQATITGGEKIGHKHLMLIILL